MLNKDQIKLVQIAAKKAGIRTAKFDGRYRLLLGKYIQPNKQSVISCKQLNNSQLDDFLAICEACGWRMPGKPATFYRDKLELTGQIASFAQQEAIRHLSEDLGMTLIHLCNFIKIITQQKKDSLSFLSPAEAGKVIEGLKAILSKKTGRKINSLSQAKNYKEARDGTNQEQ